MESKDEYSQTQTPGYTNAGIGIGGQLQGTSPANDYRPSPRQEAEKAVAAFFHANPGFEEFVTRDRRRTIHVNPLNRTEVIHLATSAATPTTIKIGDPVVVSRYNSRHEIVTSLGFVAGVDNFNDKMRGPNGEPSISVIVVDPDGPQRLGAAQFSTGLLRLTNVVAQGSEALKNRTAIATYLHEDVFLPNLLESIEPAPANPIFERIQTPAAIPQQETAQAIAVQTGKIDGPTVVSPSVAEATGQTGAEAVTTPPAPPTEPQTSETPKES